MVNKLWIYVDNISASYIAVIPTTQEIVELVSKSLPTAQVMNYSIYEVSYQPFL